MPILPRPFQPEPSGRRIIPCVPDAAGSTSAEAPPGAAADSPAQPADFLFERGATEAACGLLDPALEDLRSVTQREPDHARAWLALARVLRRNGDRAGATAAEQRAAALPILPNRPAKPVAGGKIEKQERKLQEFLARSLWRDPADLLREHLLAAPTDVAALRLLAGLEAQAGDFRTAHALLERALEVHPAYLDAREEIAGLLLQMRREAEALPHIDRMLAQNPRSEAYRRYKVAALSAIGDYDAAARLCETMAKGNSRPAFWLNYARALRFSGRRGESIAAYRKCIELAPGSGEAYWGLSYVQKDPLSAADIAAIRAQLATGAITPVDRFHFHYALGNALEKSGDHADSFSHYAQGARLCRSVNEQEGDIYSADAHSALIGRLKTICTQKLFASISQQSTTGPTPIFIVGMPRSGSTLLEQILSCHSQVEATQELPDIDYIAREIEAEATAAGSSYPECLADLNEDEREILAQRYLDRTRIYRKTQRPFFIDKMPFNWEKVGLIHLMLPNARIIDARRHPVACCFSAFKQLIARGAGYSCDLHDIGRYYRDYMDLMAHFDRVRPGLVHRVIYERMVDNTEAEIRRLLDHCGLPFESACLRFWETARAVATPSVEQVRRPIFRDALDQWRSYTPWLGPLIEALGNAPETYAS